MKAALSVPFEPVLFDPVPCVLLEPVPCVPLELVPLELVPLVEVPLVEVPLVVVVLESAPVVVLRLNGDGAGKVCVSKSGMKHLLRIRALTRLLCLCLER